MLAHAFVVYAFRECMYKVLGKINLKYIYDSNEDVHGHAILNNLMFIIE